MAKMRRIRATAATLTASSALIVISGCASPKENLIESTDEQCEIVSQRFASDLSYGDSIGEAEDLDKMRERISLIEDLQDHVREQPPPESGQDELDDWLSALDTVIEETDTMHNAFESTTPGTATDLLLVLKINIVDEAVVEAGDAAERFGFESCAHVWRWKTFGV
jgi:hypothetical protein